MVKIAQEVKLEHLRQSAVTPAGAILDYAGIPPAWLVSVRRVEQADVRRRRAVRRYGGSGSNLNVPDLRGRTTEWAARRRGS